MILQGLWQAHYLVFSTNFLKEFIKCKYGHDDKKKYKTCGITYKGSDCFLEYASFKDDLKEYKCLSCNKNYQQMFDAKLKFDDQTFQSQQ